MMRDFMTIYHSGIAHDDNPPGRGSGRFAWGSGENPGQHRFDFISEVDSLKKKGLTETQIAETLLGEGKKSTDLRVELSIAKSEKKKDDIARGLKVLDDCNGNMSEAARRLGYKNESSLRSLLNPQLSERRDRYQRTADVLKEIVDKKDMLDISKGAELYLGVPRTTLDVAVGLLEKEGYLKSWAKIPQLTTKHETTLIVLAKPGITHGDIQRNKFDIKAIQEHSPDEGKTFWTPEFPESISSKRVMVRYAEDGGKEKDGVIELRRGVEDISLGNSQYAQVRIAVDGTNYMKGMAIYSDGSDMPDGVDIIYNTNKKRGTPMIDPNAKYVYDKVTEDYAWRGNEVLKRMKINNETMEVDRDNPFGALIKGPKDRDGIISAAGQRHYIDKDGKDRLSPINKLQDEGDWDTWSRNLSSQFLSKQPMKLINQQLDLSINGKKVELDEIRSLTNPVIKKRMLEDFANQCDANASDLSAKGFKNQAYQVILPIPEMSPKECYAPNFKDGDTVALIRYPHGGIFEIPILTVNNRHEKAKSIMQNASDAIGINSQVAEQLSGADFDGDFVIVAPVKSNRLGISSRKPLDDLKDFDPKSLYKLPDDAPWIKSQTKQTEMGKVSNLITDMTIGGASFNEISRAVKHSMVVIDAEKHHLDYKQSYKDNNIERLKKDYQGYNEETKRVRGASTILSLAGSTERVPERKEVTDIYKMTPEEVDRWNKGYKIYHLTGKRNKVLISDPSKMTEEELKLHKAGKKVYREGNIRTEEVNRMDLVDDAFDFVRDKSNVKEIAYANYANNLKQLARDARIESRSIKPYHVDTEARKTYSEEVESLNRKLRIAQLNNPREREALRIANAEVSIKFRSNPGMDYQHKQREQALALNRARALVGAKKEKIIITDREWEAIQSNAISTNKLSEILINTDQEEFKKRAMPKKSSSLSSAQILLAKSMYSSGMYTQKEIADKLGVSASLISTAIRN